MNKQVRSFKDLDTWKMSMDLVKNVYLLTSHFPKDERFGITGQMRRSAISIPSNIAEGYGRWGKVEYARFCRIAFGSSTELETQLLLSKELQLAKLECFTASEDLLGHTQRLLNRLIQSLAR